MRPSALAAGTYFGRPEKRRVVGALTLCRTSYAPRERIPAHVHDAGYLCLALGGSFREQGHRGEEEVLAGSAVLHRPGERHADHFGARRSTCLNVAFRPEWAIRLGAKLNEEGPARYAPPPSVAALVQRIAQEFEARDEASTLALEGLVLELLAVFVRDEDRGERRAPRWLVEALERLHDVEPISLAELAADAGVHPSTVARTFRRFHGCSLGEYRRAWRLARALEELRASSAPLAEVAARAGFADQSHFTRAVRAATRSTPAAIRRDAR